MTATTNASIGLVYPLSSSSFISPGSDIEFLRRKMKEGIDSLGEDLNSFKNKYCELQNIYDQLDKHTCTSDSIVGHLKTELRNSNDVILTLKKELECLKAENNALMEMNDFMNTKFEEATFDSSVYKETCTKLQNEINNLKSSIN